MSCFITAFGEISFPNRDLLDQAVAPLVAGGWLSRIGSNYCFSSETDDLAVEGNTLFVHDGCYRNLSGSLGIVTDENDNGWLNTYSTDGSYELSVFKDGRWFNATTSSAILKLFSDPDQKTMDLFNLNADDWMKRYPEEDHFYFEEMVMRDACREAQQRL